jgi:hypothetical protein
MFPSLQFALKMAGRQRRGLAARDNAHMSRGDDVEDFVVNADVLVSELVRRAGRRTGMP